MAGKSVVVLPSPPSGKCSTKSARQRLMTDLKEVQSNPLPTISANIVNDNLFYWHCNLRGPAGTTYENGIFHIALSFPMNYPYEPPSLFLCTPIPHAFVANHTVCLDMLSPATNEPYKGWSSAYSVQSILVQLQSFLFEKPDLTVFEPDQILKAIASSKQFRCSQCEHRPRRPWPEFKTVGDDADWNLVKTEEMHIREELLCFHTRANFLQKPLGVGISTKRNARTQAIQNVKCSLDLLSIYAFNNLGVRKSASNIPFTYWLPLYLNKEHGAKSMNLAKKAIAMIHSNSTRDFQPEMVLDILPKLMSTMVVEMCSDTTHTSVKALQGFCAFHQLLLQFLMEFPQLKTAANTILKKFIDHEEERHKDIVPSLGDFLCLFAISDIGWDEFKQAYMEESLQRQAFWIIQDYPELSKIKADPETDAERPSKSFAASSVGCQLLLFYLYFVEEIARPKGKTLEDIVADYEKRYGRPRNEYVIGLKLRSQEISRVSSYEQYFKEARMPEITPDELNERLRKSIVKSLERGYHGKRAEGTTVKDFYTRRIGEILEPLRKFKDESNDSVWKLEFERVFDAALQLPNDTTWRQLYADKALTYYLTRILHMNPDWKKFHEILELCQCLTQFTFTHYFPGSSYVKDKNKILSTLVTCLKNLTSLVISCRSDFSWKGSRTNKLLYSLSRGLTMKNPKSLNSLTLEGLRVNDSSIKPYQEFMSVLNSLPLTTLTLKGCYWLSESKDPRSPHVLNCLSTFIKQTTTLTTLQITEVRDTRRGGDDIVLRLSQGLRENSTLTTLDFTPYGDLQTELFINVLASVGQIPSLRNLRARSHVGHESSKAWWDLLKAYETFLKTTHVTTLDIDVSWTTEDRGSPHFGSAIEFWKALAAAPITHLTLANIPSNSDSCGVCTLFQQSKTIQDLTIIGTFSRIELEQLSNGTPFTIPLRKFRYNPSSGSSVHATFFERKRFNEFLIKLGALETLSIKGTPRDLHTFAATTKTLTDLTLTAPKGEAHPKATDVRELASALASNSFIHLTCINLCGRKFGPIGAAYFAEYLRTASSAKQLKELLLADNRLGPHGTTLIAGALVNHVVLEKLDFGWNHCKDKGAKAIAEFVKGAPSLKKLVVKNNFIRERGLLLIGAAVLTSKSVSELYMANNLVSLQSLEKLKVLLNKKPELFSDILGRFVLFRSERLDRTICITKLPTSSSEGKVRKLLLGHGCGAIRSISMKSPFVSRRRRRGNGNMYSYCFVEFDTEESVTRALDLGSGHKAIIDRQLVGIYKAGTSQAKGRKKAKKSA